MYENVIDSLQQVIKMLEEEGPSSLGAVFARNYVEGAIGLLDKVDRLADEQARDVNVGIDE